MVRLKFERSIELLEPLRDSVHANQDRSATRCRPKGVRLEPGRRLISCKSFASLPMFDEGLRGDQLSLGVVWIARSNPARSFERAECSALVRSRRFLAVAPRIASTL